MFHLDFFPRFDFNRGFDVLDAVRFYFPGTPCDGEIAPTFFTDLNRA
jgi:hypothetical protein